jgi:hypothetical protein
MAGSNRRSLFAPPGGLINDFGAITIHKPQAKVGDAAFVRNQNWEVALKISFPVRNGVRLLFLPPGEHPEVRKIVGLCAGAVRYQILRHLVTIIVHRIQHQPGD